MCLLAPCAKPSQTYVYICTSYNEEHDVTYSTKKYVCLMIKSHKCVVLLIYDTNLIYWLFKFVSALCSELIDSAGCRTAFVAYFTVKLSQARR